MRKRAESHNVALTERFEVLFEESCEFEPGYRVWRSRDVDVVRLFAE